MPVQFTDGGTDTNYSLIIWASPEFSVGVSCASRGPQHQAGDKEL